MKRTASEAKWGDHSLHLSDGKRKIYSKTESGELVIALYDWDWNCLSVRVGSKVFFFN